MTRGLPMGVMGGAELREVWACGWRPAEGAGRGRGGTRGLKMDPETLS